MNRTEQIAMIAAQRHAELLREAEQYRLVKHALRDSRPRNITIAKILAFVGKEFISIGHSIEIRFSGQSEPHPALNPQTNPGNCT